MLMKKTLGLNLLLLGFYSYGFVFSEPMNSKCSVDTNGKSFCATKSKKSFLVNSENKIIYQQGGTALSNN